jgi:integration host factor subunit beta
MIRRVKKKAPVLRNLSGLAISFEPRTKFAHLLCSKGVTLETGAQLTMTKAELVEEVTQLGDLTRRDGEVIVDTIFDAVIGALKSGDKIEIRGFGSFRIRQRKPRIGRNPKTGAKVEVPAKRVPYFKPSKELRDLVNPHEAAGATHAAPPA